MKNEQKIYGEVIFGNKPQKLRFDLDFSEKGFSDKFKWNVLIT